MKVYHDKDGPHFQMPVFQRVGIDEIVLAVQMALESGKLKKLKTLKRTKALRLTREMLDAYGGMVRHSYSPDAKAMKFDELSIRLHVSGLFYQLVYFKSPQEKDQSPPDTVGEKDQSPDDPDDGNPAGPSPGMVHASQVQLNDDEVEAQAEHEAQTKKMS